MLIFDKLFARKISISSKEANNIDNTLLQKLKGEVEGFCIEDNYYILHINEIKSRTLGIIDINNLAGDIQYDIWYNATVITIKPDDIIVGAVIINVKPAGLFLEYDTYIKIFITSEYTDPEIETYEINEKYNVYVLGVRFDIGKNKIDIVGKIHFYSPVAEEKRYLALPPIMTKSKKFKIDLITTNIKKPIVPQYQGISQEIYDFYQKLLNPYSSILTTAAEIKEVITVIPELKTAKFITINGDSFTEVQNALANQKEGYHILAHFTSTATKYALDILYILYEYHTDVLLYKTQISNQDSLDIYVACLNFKGKTPFLQELKTVKIKDQFIKQIIPQDIKTETFNTLMRSLNERLKLTKEKKINEIIDTAVFYNMEMKIPQIYKKKQEKIIEEYNLKIV